jgi:hypothetical protein
MNSASRVFKAAPILIVLAYNAMAETGDYNFTLGKKPEDKPIVEEKPKVYLGYPKGDYGISLNPGLYSFSQTLVNTGSKFNFSNFSASDFSLSFRARTSPSVLLGLDFNYHSVSTAAADLQQFQIASSSVSVISTVIYGAYCYSLGDAAHKICPGIDLGVDTYPILEFESNTSLTLKKLNDVSVGPSLTYLSPLGGKMSMRMEASYRVGLKQGQAAGYTMNSDHVFALGAEGLAPVGKTARISFGAGVRSQSASFSHLQDRWQMSNVSYLFSLGYRIAWGGAK